MSSFNLNPVQISGIPLSEVQPATIQGTFTHTFAAAPTDVRYVLPGDNRAIATGEGAWLLYTRSVMSYNIRFEGAQGGSIHIEVASTSAIGVPFWSTWQLLGLQPDNLMSSLSGLELPGGLIARFSIISGTAAISDCEGSITLRAL